MNIPFIPDMHRIQEGKADWDLIPQAEWNQWQHRAAETHGLDTPGNRETLKGLLLSLGGLACIAEDKPIAGTVLIGAGRVCDLRDGKKAAQTGTKSPLGEAFDVLTDNALLAASVPVLTAKEIISKEEAAALGGTLAMKFIGTGVTRVKGQREHASRLGKYGQLLQWVGIGTRLLERIGQEYKVRFLAEKAAAASDISLRVGIGASAMAGTGYLLNGLFGRHKKY